MFDIATLYTDAAKVDLLYWQNARLADELQNVTGTLQLERTWMLRAYKLLGGLGYLSVEDTLNVVETRQTAPEWLRKGQT